MTKQDRKIWAPLHFTLCRPQHVTDRIYFSKMTDAIPEIEYLSLRLLQKFFKFLLSDIFYGIHFWNSKLLTVIINSFRIHQEFRNPVFKKFLEPIFNQNFEIKILGIFETFGDRLNSSSSEIVRIFRMNTWICSLF